MERAERPTLVRMVRGRLLAVCAVSLGCLVAGSPALADAGGSAATLRSAAERLITAELAGDGVGACAVLNAPLTGVVGGRSCAQRWDARSAGLTASGRLALRRDLAAAARAAVTIDGEHGSIALPVALLHGHSHFYWTANCWMLTR